MSWIQCWACGLRYSARADRKCPRCRAEEGSRVPVLPPSAWSSPTPPPAPVPPAPPGDGEIAARLAGRSYLVFGVFTLLSALAIGQVSPLWGFGVFGACVDVALGGLLLCDAEWPRSAALYRSFLGIAAVFLIPFLFGGGGEAEGLLNVLRLLIRLFFFGGMMILLPGGAGPRRRWAGALVAFVPYVAIKVVGAFVASAQSLDYGAPPVAAFLRGFLQVG